MEYHQDLVCYINKCLRTPNIMIKIGQVIGNCLIHKPLSKVAAGSKLGSRSNRNFGKIIKKRCRDYNL